MKKTGLLFSALSLCLLMTACGRKNTYTDYTGYLNDALVPGQTAQSEAAAPPPASVNTDFANVVTILSSPAPAATAFPSSGGAASANPGTPAAGSAQAPVYTPPAPDSVVTYNPGPAPASIQTPLPTQAPSPTPYIPTVKITKSPTSETVYEGGSALFIAKAENYDRIVWITVSPDKRTSYEIGDAPGHFSGLVIEGQGTGNLRLNNIPYSMNGWRIQAYFTGNGGPSYTAGAYLTVLQDTPVYPTAAPGDNVQALVENLAKQAYNEVYYSAGSKGYSVSSISNYSYANALADFNVTFSNRLFTITAEFNACYYSNTSYGAGPVYAAVYDSFGTLLASQRMTGASMNELYTFLDGYRQ